jgi:hypothetical protein
MKNTETKVKDKKEKVERVRFTENDLQNIQIVFNHAKSAVISDDAELGRILSFKAYITEKFNTHINEPT